MATRIKKTNTLFPVALTALILVAFSAAAQTTEVSVTQTLGGSGLATGGTSYVAGGQLEITITFSKTGADTIWALGFTTIIPDTWTFAGFVGTHNPPVYPQDGATGTLEFAWITTPAFPATFTFLVSIPEEASGTGCLDSFSSYRLSGGLLESNHANTCLTPEEATEGEGQTEGQTEGEGEGGNEPGVCGCNCAKDGFALQDIDQWLGDFLLAGLSIGILFMWGRMRTGQ